MRSGEERFEMRLGVGSSWRLLVNGLLVVGLVAAGCTGVEAVGEDSSTSTETVVSEQVEPETTTTTTATTTSVVLDPDEEAVLALLDRFFVDLRDRPDRTRPIDSWPDVASEIMVDPVLSRWQEIDTQNLELDRRDEIYPSLYHVMEVEIDGDSAEVMTCDLGRGAGYSAEGELVVPSAGSFGLSVVRFVRLDDGWWISDWIDPRTSEEPALCDPVELWGPFTDDGQPDNGDGEFDDVGDPAVIAEVTGRFEDYVTNVWTFDERVQDVAEMTAPIEEYATRTEVYWMNRIYDEQAIQDSEADLVLDGWDIRVESVRVDGDQARILTCGHPKSQYLSVDDESLLAAETEPEWEVAYMLKEPDGRWRVEFFWTGNEEPCE